MNFAQSVSEQNSHTFRLGDSLQVELLEAIEPPSEHIRGYYYLPNNLRLSEGEAGQPEFLLMSYKRENTDEEEVIMHWLFTWGLTAKQQKAIDSLAIVKIDSSARVLGALMLTADAKYYFSNQQKSTVLINALESGITSGGIVPTQADGKSATSFRFKGEAAKLILEAVKNENKAKGIYLNMGFNYKVLKKYKTGLNVAENKRIILQIGLDEVFKKAKTCKECIVIMN